MCIFSSAFPSIFHCLRGVFLGQCGLGDFHRGFGVTGIPFDLPRRVKSSLRIFRQVIRHLFRLIDANPPSARLGSPAYQGSKIFGFSLMDEPARRVFPVSKPKVPFRLNGITRVCRKPRPCRDHWVPRALRIFENFIKPDRCVNWKLNQ